MSKSFRVEAPIDRVWAFLSDMEQVTTCLPGVEYNGPLGDDRHGVTMTIKVGPIKTSYKGEAAIEEQDPSEYRIRIMGKGQDTKGKGGATMELSGSLEALDDEATQVRGDSTLTISGLLAQFGSRMIQDVSDQMFEQFTNAMRKKLEGSPEGSEADVDTVPTAIRGTALAATAIKGTLRRTMSAAGKKFRRSAGSGDGESGNSAAGPG